MDEKSISQHVRPWQQMLMFFARTQREHGWKSPRYRFTRTQREAWEALVRRAEGSAGREDDEEDDDDDDDDDGDDDDGEEDDDDDDEDGNNEEDEVMADDIDEMERDGEHTTPNAIVNAIVGAIVKPKTLSSIQKACLEFCIALLSQSITRKEYDSPLVCALAVLGVKEDGWKGAEQYPPILSAVIKVARFMVVQQALELSGPLDEDDDSAYEGNDSSPPRRRPKGCLQIVQEMVDQFMVRGSHSPTQWMLDLRTYGLKIHYNTTSRGHVEWVGADELLYKSLQFNMAQFRSMVHGLAVESRRVMVDELLFGSSPASKPVPAVPWATMRDNPTDERPRWNF
jgi:hypothetical protein